jgi:methionine-rich copper-binding protein CopC
MFRQALAAVAMLGAFAASPCMAHAKLVSSVPEDDALLTTAPKTLTLKFDERGQLAVLRLMSNGEEIPITVDELDTVDTSFTAALPVLAPGKYEVRWTMVAVDDGHVTKGSFSFLVMPPPPKPH